MANIGTVQSVTGIVRAIAADGTERILSVGDTVAENEKIITGDGVIVIAFNDGTVMDLGSNSSIVLNDDMLIQEGKEAVAQSWADAEDEVAALQETLLNNPNFDPANLPATAAGPAGAGTGGNNGHTLVSVDHLNPEAVQAGFDTLGIARGSSQVANEEHPAVVTIEISMTPVNDLTDGNESVTATEDTAWVVAAGDADGLLQNTVNGDGPNTETVTQFTWGSNEDVAVGNTATLLGVGTLLINSDGSYTFTPDANYAGTVLDATYDVTDGVDTVTSTLAISIIGVAVEAGNLDDGTVVDATVATGQMVSSDVDNGATVTWTHSGGETPVYGSFAITPAGVWTYTVDATPSSAADMMNEGDECLETFEVTVTDQHDATAIETVTVLIKGTNDSPIAVEDTYYLGDNIIVNGGFENPDVGGDFTMLGAGETIGAWSIDSGSIDLINGHWPASEGDQSLDLNGDNAGTISQSFATVTGTTYTVTFDMSANGDINNIVQMVVSAAGVTANYQYDADQNTMTAMNWSSETFTFVATSATTTLEFEGLEASPPWAGIALDNVQVRAINAELSTDENTAITIDVLANDTDVDSGDAPGNFSLDAVSIASGLPDNPTGTPATVSIVDNKLVFNPGADFDYLAGGKSTTVVVSYTMSDDTDAVSSSTATIIVTGDNPTMTAPDVKVIPEDSIATDNVLENDVDIDSSLSVVSFVVADNTTVYTAGAPASINNIGTITIAANGDYTFSPVANWSGEMPQITYTTNTGVNDTLDVTVTPVADAPTLIMSVSEPEVSGAGQVIDLSDSSGGNLFAYADSTAINFANLADTGATLSFNPGNGLGVETTNESQADGAAVLDGTEAAVIVLANGASSVVQVDIRHVDNEPVLVQVYDVNGVLLGSVTVTGANNADLTAEITADTNLGTGIPKYVVLGGPDNLNGGKYGFNIAGVRTVGTGTSLFTYTLSVAATLTDVDSSESLGSVLIEASTIPTDVTVQDASGTELTAIGGFYTVAVDADGAAALTLVSDDVLTSAEINAISGSVTATETTGIANPVADQSATSTEPALLEIFADAGANELTGFDGSELIKGMDGDDIIIGGEGNDVIFGGKGADTLTGGLGADTFVWTKADADGSADTVIDFNIAEGDSINLADLLSDGSHAIEGVDNGGDLRLVISDTNSNIVQTINLTDVSIAGNFANTLQTLLDNGGINDGI